MESVTWVKTLDEAVCILLYANALEKRMNSSLLSHPAMGKW